MNALPCPFCGKPPGTKVTHTEEYRVFVTCESCGANGPSLGIFGADRIPGSSRDRAIEAWNRRVPTPAPQFLGGSEVAP